MSKPNQEDWMKLKRIGRYLKGVPRAVIWYQFEDWDGVVRGWSDTDYAGCTKTRKSTSGGMIKKGSHYIKSWSVNQDAIALSSGEAEYYGLVRTATQSIGIKSLLKDMGIESGITLYTDASAAKGMAHRTGVGRVRQLDVSQLWLQERVRKGEINVHKVGTNDNPADCLTKCTSSTRSEDS